ncbi:MAG: DUF4271 domain-containing protein [Muribaculaceae bacterium]|nr:DUF4271 domain-containing protein [Bacteroides sp.]MDE6679947.1 DUF4271 domain-containing protein [Muribaculaceae bacterium]MDE6842067.1 DUF4271 domain-containing protein [Muribaculaceae bacterium]
MRQTTDSTAAAPAVVSKTSPVTQTQSTAGSPGHSPVPTQAHSSAKSAVPHPEDMESAASDTTAVADTTRVEPGELNGGITLTPPPRIELKGEGGQTLGMSFVLLGLFVIFTTVCLRFKNNVRYLQVLWRDLIEIRMRHNVFDDTVRETSFLVLLNLLWCASAGVLLHSLVTLTWNDGLSITDSRPPLPEWTHLPMLICIGVATCYTLFMMGVLWLTGIIFTDRNRAALWVKGYAAAQGLLSFIFFPLALLCQSYPGEQMTFLYVAGGALVLAKLIFIWKGLRIFFNQFSSWVLFLYYLCSLEIVPLILTYIAAVLLCVLLV